MRKSLRASKKASSHNPLAEMSGLASRGLQCAKGVFASTTAKMMASLLMTIGIVTGWAMADPALESLEQMLPQRPGMKTEQDYKHFAQERGLPERSEPTREDMDRLRSQSQRELKLEEEYSRRNSSNLSNMTDAEILEAIRLNRDGSVEPPAVDAREDWPKSSEEFEKKYGRPPQRREEVDFYFDNDDDISQDEERPNR